MWGSRHQVERKSRVVQNIEQQEALAKQVLNGRLDTVIKTIEHNVRLV